MSGIVSSKLSLFKDGSRICESKSVVPLFLYHASSPDVCELRDVVNTSISPSLSISAEWIDVPFVGGNGFNSPQVIEIAGDASEGLIVATPWFGEKDEPKVQEFVKKYEEKYGAKPDQFAAQAYDALYIMAEGLKNAGEADRDALRDSLAEIKDLDGVLGKFSFDEEGDVVMEPTVLVIKEGKFQLFE